MFSIVNGSIMASMRAMMHQAWRLNCPFRMLVARTHTGTLIWPVEGFAFAWSPVGVVFQNVGASDGSARGKNTASTAREFLKDVQRSGEICNG